jgi:hypothetical protein
MKTPDFFIKKDGKTKFVDPRPDLSSPKESRLFGMLLAKAWGKNPELCMLLHGFRCQGTTLAAESNIKLQPVISLSKGWPSIEDYNKEKKRLMPFLEIIKSLFKELRGCLDG